MKDVNSISEDTFTCPFHEEFMSVAWRDFILYAWAHPDFRKEFTKKTGSILMPNPRNGIDAMIDAACGLDRDSTALTFMVWATVTHWGLDTAPPAFQAKVAELHEAGKLKWYTPVIRPANANEG